jgi:hypothetical protein
MLGHAETILTDYVIATKSNITPGKIIFWVDSENNKRLMLVLSMLKEDIELYIFFNRKINYLRYDSIENIFYYIL